MSSPLWLHGLYSPWNSPGQNTGVGSLSLLQGIFPTQGLNWHLLCFLHWQADSLLLRDLGRPPVADTTSKHPSLDYSPFLVPLPTSPQNTFSQILVSRSGPVRNQKKPGAAMLGLCEAVAQNLARIGHSVSVNAPILWMKTSGGRDQPDGRQCLQDGN